MLGTVADADTGLPFPFELVIRDTPISAQTSNGDRREKWKTRIGTLARERINALVEMSWIDDRPLAATIYYFPRAEMQGDIDNIVKPILDELSTVVYPRAIG